MSNSFRAQQSPARAAAFPRRPGPEQFATARDPAAVERRVLPAKCHRDPKCHRGHRLAAQAADADDCWSTKRVSTNGPDRASNYQDPRCDAGRGQLDLPGGSAPAGPFKSTMWSRFASTRSRESWRKDRPKPQTNVVRSDPDRLDPATGFSIATRPSSQRGSGGRG